MSKLIQLVHTVNKVLANPEMYSPPNKVTKIDSYYIKMHTTGFQVHTVPTCAFGEHIASVRFSHLKYLFIKNQRYTCTGYKETCVFENMIIPYTIYPDVYFNLSCVENCFLSLEEIHVLKEVPNSDLIIYYDLL